MFENLKIGLTQLKDEAVAAWDKSPAVILGAFGGVGMTLYDQFVAHDLSLRSAVPVVIAFAIRAKVWSPNSVNEVLDDAQDLIDRANLHADVLADELEKLKQPAEPNPDQGALFDQDGPEGDAGAVA